MRTPSLKNLTQSLILVSVLLLYPISLPAATVTDIRFWSAPDHTRVVLDLTESIQYESSSQENPPQFHLEMKRTSCRIPKREIEVNNPFVSKMSLIEVGTTGFKLILHQKKPLQVSVFPLKPYMDKPPRLVIDLVDAAAEQKEQDEREKQKEMRPKGTKIVVVDPGHGGEESGAIGPKKTMEKDIVLKVGEKVIRLLNQNQNREVQAFLTRKGDYFIPLEGRVKIAREYKADLFMSLHTDASFNPQARGSSLYCLSLSGATDQAAKILADNENMSNVLGGAFLRRASFSKIPKVNQILLDLMQNNSMKESFRFSENLLEDISAIHRLKYPSYRQASFIVLKAPDIPSVLVEMAFISNKEDERLLNQNEFQEKMANTLVTSIQKYFKP